MIGSPAAPALSRRPRIWRFVDLGMLYFSKSGAVVVNLLILPQLQNLMSPEDFGLVAVFLTVQALMLVLDLGLSLIVGRDVAIAKITSGRALRTWRTAELVLSATYVPFLIGCSVFAGLNLLPFDLRSLAFAIATFWLLTLQNVGYSALIARRDFATAAGILVTGTVLRGVLSLIALMMIVPRLEVFLAVQAGCSLVQYVVTKVRCEYVLGRPVPRRARRWPGITALTALLWRARSLAVFGMAGALVLQGDKLIISAFNTPSVMAPYYLATTLCLVPISSLAGPIASYFQPSALRAIAYPSEAEAVRQLRRMLSALALVTVLPTAILWLLRGPIIDLWLVNSSSSGLVTEYTAILLPGVCIGAFGFVPYIALLGRSDFSFQARMSGTTTLITLAMTTLMAYHGNITAICWVYSVYHASSTLICWFRWYYLDRRDGYQIAAKIGKLATAILVGAALIVGISAVLF